MAISGGTQFLNPKEIIEQLGLIEGMKVADLGCGNLGSFIIPAAKAVGKSGLAYAVDILPSVLESVRGLARLDGLTNLELLRANLENPSSINIPAGSLDMVFLKNVLFQNKNQAALIESAHRLLKVGGKLLIIDWKKTGVPFGPPVEIRVDKEKIKSLASDLKLKLLMETEFGEYFWGLIYEK
ncbi:MAG: class I SAM-dependent methyltransferase [Patescibacteria group bacterium]|nr:class I SAM-dependent methyltransferase [Patescibacteria group bacterium]